MEMLEKIEHLERPLHLHRRTNGYVPQGPSTATPYQRHLSDSYPHDFEGHRYRVHGSLGTKYLRG